MSHPLVIIGGGMSGIAAAIRHARFGQPTLILERHSRPGGLNSYYYRHGRLFETGLHAMTNFARPDQKRAPLNILLRQLKLSRKNFTAYPQFGSEINFPQRVLRFSNDFSELLDDVQRVFPKAVDGFNKLAELVKGYDPFQNGPWLSARKCLNELIDDQDLIEMIFCPLMFYGNSEESDMDFSQFVIMFQAIFFEGFFRPFGTIKDFLAVLLDQYKSFGGEIRYQTSVDRLCLEGNTIVAVQTTNGEKISCSNVISTIGLPGTNKLLSPEQNENEEYVGRLSFVESIYLVPKARMKTIKNDSTSIFFSTGSKFTYRRPQTAVDTTSGVINFPDNFHGVASEEMSQIRVTNMANFDLWLQADGGAVRGGNRSPAYDSLKKRFQVQSLGAVQKIIGVFDDSIAFEDTFTPLTIERYTSKAAGAVYGSPVRVKDGLTPCDNLFIAGTDQGFLGIVGAMLSGVTMVNNHILL
nr:NAD(P)/FAD-dependent oxidoreductase [Desulfobulbaceae bacterium]